MARNRSAAERNRSPVSDFAAPATGHQRDDQAIRWQSERLPRRADRRKGNGISQG